MKNHYKEKLKNNIIFNYIKEHGKAPTREKVFELTRLKQKDYPRIKEVGFSGSEIKGPEFMTESSAYQHNKNKKAIREDVSVLEQQIDDLTVLMEESFRGFISVADMCLDQNKLLDARLNNLLMLSDKSNIFLYGIEEQFINHDKVDLIKSTTQINTGYITLGRKKFEKLDLSLATLSFGAKTQSPLIAGKIVDPPENLFSDDGLFWTYELLSSNTSGYGEATVTINFNEVEGVQVDELKITGNPIDGNSTAWITVAYSLDGANYNTIRPANLRMLKGENLISVGKKNVKKLKIYLSKEAPDTVSGTNGKYIFSLDTIEIINGNYKIDNKSILYAGPYEIKDESGDPVNFSMATIDHGTCCIIPDQTSVSFFLSKDNTNWYPAAFNQQMLDIVQFGSTLPENKTLLDSSKQMNTILSESQLKKSNIFLELKKGKEGVLNVYIPSKDKSNFVRQNTKIKRNLSVGDKELYGVQSGWFKDEVSLQYKTCLWIGDLEGKVVDFGPTTARINGRPVSGETFIARGYHQFETNQKNWFNVPTGIKSSQQLEENDPCFPYNHKLIIEGYKYPSDFNGEKTYTGHGIQNFGSLLDYVTPERFNNAEFDGDLTIYTIEEYNGNLFFKVKINSTDASWVDELVIVDYMMRNNKENTLYVKAILSTENAAITPNINKFQVRVV